MKRGVVLATVEQGGSPPLHFPVFQTLLSRRLDLLTAATRDCPETAI
jgi:hypothetical protein